MQPFSGCFAGTSRPPFHPNCIRELPPSLFFSFLFFSSHPPSGSPVLLVASSRGGWVIRRAPGGYSVVRTKVKQAARTVPWFRDPPGTKLRLPRSASHGITRSIVMLDLLDLLLVNHGVLRTEYHSLWSRSLAALGSMRCPARNRTAKLIDPGALTVSPRAAPFHLVPSTRHLTSTGPWMLLSRIPVGVLKHGLLLSYPQGDMSDIGGVGALTRCQVRSTKSSSFVVSYAQGFVGERLEKRMNMRAGSEGPESINNNKSIWGPVVLVYFTDMD